MAHFLEIFIQQLEGLRPWVSQSGQFFGGSAQRKILVSCLNGEFVLALEFIKVFKVKTTGVDGSSES